MKALYYPEFNRLTVTERPVPSIAEDEVLLRVMACGVCGSELETFRHQSPRRKPPLIMGHEYSGIVEEFGPLVKGFSKGQYVVGNSVVSCGACPSCLRGASNLCERRQVFGMHRSGAFAERVNVPASCLVPMPEGVPHEAACLAEPLANGIHMVNLTRHLSPRKVLIIGAGPIGLLAQQAFRALVQAEVYVADLRPERLEIARRLGALGLVDSSREDLVEKARGFSGGEGMDVVIDAVGLSLTNRQALRSVRPGGGVVLIGLYENTSSLLSYDIILDEKQVIGTYAATQEEIREALKLMSEGAVDVSSWVNYYALDEGEKAFSDMLRAEGAHVKSVILTGKHSPEEDD